MNNILIGGSDGYTYDQLKPWWKSARESGFTGDIWIITYRMNSDDIARLEQDGIKIYQVNHTPYGLPIQYGPSTQAHSMRFYHAWELLTRLEQDGEKYQFVVMTDISDVIFQGNPCNWLEERLYGNEFVAASEGLIYADEEWGKDNIIRGFGEVFYDLEAKNWQIYNVGSLGGTFDGMKKLTNAIYRLTENRYYPSDQSGFNVLLRYGGFRWKNSTHANQWSCQLGTTADPTKPWLKDRLNEVPPKFQNGLMINYFDRPYYLVHQYNRVPELKEFYANKYK